MSLNSQIKRRLFVVTGIIVVVLIIVLAVVAGTTGYQTITVAQALEPEQRETRVQVSGSVVDNSYALEGDALTFAIYDPEGDPQQQLSVYYDGGISATFGNQVTAICTGTINSEGVLMCSELVTKCPSKYESATDALSVSQLAGYGDSVEGKPLKVTGYVKPGSINTIESGERLVLVDMASDDSIPVLYSGALSEEIDDNSALVITGSVNEEGKLEATDISLKED